MTPFNNAGVFLIQTVFDLFLFILIFRIVLQCVSVDFYNPISQLVFKVTQPVVKPFQKFMPLVRRFDLAALFVLLLLEMLKLVLVMWIGAGKVPQNVGLFFWASGELLNQFINVFFYSVLIMIVLGWIAPGTHSPLTMLLRNITNPLMSRARRLCPTVGGFDISPIPVMIGLKLLAIIIAHPLLKIGISLTMAS